MYLLRIDIIVLLYLPLFTLFYCFFLNSNPLSYPLKEFEDFFKDFLTLFLNEERIYNKFLKS